jgi:hypothetical protein
MTTLETFVAGIAQPQPLLAHTTGKLLFEIRGPDDTERWLVGVDKGYVEIVPVEGHVEADAIVRSERSLSEAITQGRANAMAAILRGEGDVEGDAELLMDFQRIFPGPDDPRQP